MVWYKKVLREDLLQLAILLSLLGAERELFRRTSEFHPVRIGIDDVGGGVRFENAHFNNPLNNRIGRMHPKSLDSVLLSYERDVLEDLNALGRYNRIELLNHNVTAYVLNVDVGSMQLGAMSSGGSTQPTEPTPSDASPPGSELTQEDMDLIEVLWKQDVDLGFSVEYLNSLKEGASNDSKPDAPASGSVEEIEKIKILNELNCSSSSTKSKDESDPEEEKPEDPWAGLPYTVDSETGEYVVTSEEAGVDSTDARVPEASDIPLGGTARSLALSAQASEEEALDFQDDFLHHLFGMDQELARDSSSSSPSPLDFNHDLDLVGEWIDDISDAQTRVLGRAPYGRAVSMEQRWQDLANLLSLPAGQQGVQGQQGQQVVQHDLQGHLHHHHHHLHHHTHTLAGHPGHPAHPAHPQHFGYDSHPDTPGTPGTPGASPARSVVLHNATLAPPVGDLNSSSVYSGLSMGNAVAQSMNLTNSSEPMGDGSPSSNFKIEPPHDMMYYQNSSSGAELSQLAPLNSSTEGFLSSILNDEDLQLMDMMNDSMYPLRMLESNASGLMGAAGAAGAGEERLDASSDSAVSSMGSERVSSLSDGGEWLETSSDSGHHLDCKYRHHGQDYGSYSPLRLPPGGGPPGGGAGAANGGGGGGGGGGPAQKKHQMFGKRYFQGEQATGGLPVGHPPAAAPMATPMPLKLDFGGEAGHASRSQPLQGPLHGPLGPQAVPGPAAPAAPTASAAPAGSASAFSSPMSLDEDELRAHDLKFNYYGHEYPRHHHARPPMEPVAHNHTYHLPPPPESSGAIQRPQQRDKPKCRDSRRGDDGHLTRDEKRARALNVPMTVDDIINLPMDEFNERLSKHDLSEAQLSLIRDIRRRGKNKVAAQNCRKRKLDQIVSLADEVQQMRSRKQKLLREHDYLYRETDHAKEKFSQLYRHVFSALRDVDGSPYSPYEYSLQQGPDGNVMLVSLASSSGSLVEPAHQQMSRSMSDAAASHPYTRSHVPQHQHQPDRQKDPQSQHQQHLHGSHAPHQPHHPNPHPPHHPHSEHHHKE